MKNQLEELQKEEILDISPFNPSPAVYFMDGNSDATIRLRGSKEELYFDFQDKNTSIAASSPNLLCGTNSSVEAYVPVPPPLKHVAKIPINSPEFYIRNTTAHLMQVVSMNMKKKGTSNRLLIGVPYAEKYPEIFYNSELFPEGSDSAASFGMVSSLTDFVNEKTGEKEITSNGYPARSFFAIYHIIETPVGAFFNKKATQMELQKGENGKYALSLPPLPFMYELINGPIPLYDVTNPTGAAVADVIMARHHDGKVVETDMSRTDDVWPFHRPNLEEIESTLVKNDLLKFESFGK